MSPFRHCLCVSLHQGHCPSLCFNRVGTLKAVKGCARLSTIASASLSIRGTVHLCASTMSTPLRQLKDALTILVGQPHRRSRGPAKGVLLLGPRQRSLCAFDPFPPIDVSRLQLGLHDFSEGPSKPSAFFPS
jgi:hypothetical protein